MMTAVDRTVVFTNSLESANAAYEARHLEIAIPGELDI